MPIMKSACVASTLGILLSAAHAQQPSAPAAVASAPTAPGATAAKRVDSIYRSAFDGYRRYAEPPVVSWKEANDNVGRIGGWRVYAQEASGDEAVNPRAAHAAPQSSSGQTPPRAGKANTEKPFGQTQTTNPPKTAPKPAPAPSAGPAASQPEAPAGHSQHH